MPIAAAHRAAAVANTPRRPANGLRHRLRSGCGADAGGGNASGGVCASPRSPHVAGRLVDRAVGYPSRPRRAIARKLAVDIERMGKTAPARDVAFGLRFLPYRPRLPTGALGDCIDEIDRARILQIAQSVLNGVDASFISAFVVPGFVLKGVRQRRD